MTRSATRRCSSSTATGCRTTVASSSTPTSSTPAGSCRCRPMRPARASAPPRWPRRSGRRRSRRPSPPPRPAPRWRAPPPRRWPRLRASSLPASRPSGCSWAAVCSPPDCSWRSRHGVARTDGRSRPVLRSSCAWPPPRCGPTCSTGHCASWRRRARTAAAPCLRSPSPTATTPTSRCPSSAPPVRPRHRGRRSRTVAAGSWQPPTSAPKSWTCPPPTRPWPASR